MAEILTSSGIPGRTFSSHFKQALFSPTSKIKDKQCYSGFYGYSLTTVTIATNKIPGGKSDIKPDKRVRPGIPNFSTDKDFLRYISESTK